MLNSCMKGFAVTSKNENGEITGISFSSESFEHCKEYCYNGSIIVTATPVKSGFNFRCIYHKNNSWFKWNKYEKCIFKFHINFGWEYLHKYGKEALYTNPLSYSETVNKKHPNE